MADPAAWVPLLDDRTPELRVAASLALGRDDRVKDRRLGALRCIVTPTTGANVGRDRLGRVEWTTGPPAVEGLGHRPINHVLADVLALRSRAEMTLGEDRRSSDDPPGLGGDAIAAEPWFPWGLDVALHDAESLAAGVLDLERAGRLLAGLLLLRPAPWLVVHRWPRSDALGVSAAWRVLAPFFSRHTASMRGRPVRLRPLPGWGARLAAGRGSDWRSVLGEARTRLLMARLQPISRVDGIGRDADPRLLAAALLVSPPRSATQRALEGVAVDPSELDQQGAPT